MFTDEDGMRSAIAKAREGLQKPGGGEVGCAIVREGRVLQLAQNEVERRNDPTAHAEMVAIRKAMCQARNRRVKGIHTPLHLAAVRNVLVGVRLGGDQPDRLRCHAGGC